MVCPIIRSMLGGIRGAGVGSQIGHFGREILTSYGRDAECAIGGAESSDEFDNLDLVKIIRFLPGRLQEIHTL